MLAAAFLLGITGSLGHCVGMCGGIALLLGGREGRRGWLLANAGRLVGYTLLGALAGLGGRALLVLPGHVHHGAAGSSALLRVQGVVALAASVVALYMALALLGRARSPEVLLAGLTRRWGGLMRRGAAGGAAGPFALGVLWGFLPCGLVLAALLFAMTTHSPLAGAATMLAFGLGTWPALLGAAWVARRVGPRLSPPGAWPRRASALLVLLFSAQLTLRGLAAWGWVSHAQFGSLMLW